MSEQNKKTQDKQENLQINDLLMKPFSLGWTREVVMRVITKNGAPNCDIYYFSPSKRRIRSYTELKSILTDGLSLECFSFKREPLGLTPDLETIRNAKVRGKKLEKIKEKELSVERNLKKVFRPNSLREENVGNENELKKEEEETKMEMGKVEIEKKENDDKTNMKNIQEAEEINDEVEKNPETRSKRIIKDGKGASDKGINEKMPRENINFKNVKKTRRKGGKLDGSVKLQSVRQKKNVLKKMMSAKQAKQSKVVATKKTLKKNFVKIVKAPKQKLSKKRDKKEINLKNTRNKKIKLQKERKSVKNSFRKAKNETAKEPESDETDKKSASRDLKSIVKKNIGKYREMREKQKLGAVKNQVRSTSKKTASPSVSRMRSEPISKNKPFYLKPLQKGWRRELVYRSNCARAGQRADVYYFHPSGKKLRSCREIAENLTHGLSIECFTFRKEPIGCGEPSEVIRNARFIQKN